MAYEQPWTWRGYDSETDPAAFGPLAGIVRMWRERWPDGSTFPRWSDFDLMDFEGWWGQIALCEIRDEPFDLYWILWGTKLTDWWSIDYTGQLMSDLDKFADIWRNHEHRYFEDLTRRRRVGFVTGSLAHWDRGFLSVRGVDLPLERDGRVDRVMTVFQQYRPDMPFVPDAPAIYEDSTA